jgi:hypothetical protein
VRLTDSCFQEGGALASENEELKRQLEELKLEKEKALLAAKERPTPMPSQARTQLGS